MLAEGLSPEVFDSRLKTFYQVHLRKSPHVELKNLRLCGTGVINVPFAESGVFLLENGKKAKFFGVATCHSSWACPCCTAKSMAKHGERIACAIDALKKWYHQSAFMVTLTLPHLKFMSCEDTFEILKRTWHKFEHSGSMTKKYTLKTTIGENHTGGRSVGKAGEVRILKASKDPYMMFRRDVGIDYIVRSYEFTYGEEFHWHPHIHALFWAPDKNWAKILNHEQALVDYWWKCAVHEAKKYYTKKFSAEKAKEIVDELYADYKKTPVTGHKAFFISKTADGKPRKQESSYYIVGWSGDKELTADKVKGTHKEGHVTPSEMLRQAYECQLSDPEKSERYLKLYDEYALATKGKRRLSFTPGVVKIIKKWQSTNDYVNVIKKKFMERMREDAPFRVVCWFNREQWLKICWIEAVTHITIRADLLELAMLPKPREKIRRYLAIHDIELLDKELLVLTPAFVEELVFENKFASAFR